MRYAPLLIILALLAAPAAALNDQTTLTDQQPAQNIPDPEASYDKTIDDLPLMPGLATVPEEDMLRLTSRSGQITESRAQGIVDVDQVYVFYRQTLPPLGWTKTGPRNFTRNDENLTIDAHADGKLTTVTFSLQPK